MSGETLLNRVSEMHSNEQRVHFLRSLVLGLYTDFLASGRIEQRTTLEAVLASGETLQFDLHALVSRPQAVAPVLKAVFAAQPSESVDVIACRVEDELGTGEGLLLTLNGIPALTFGPLADGCGMFMRQIEIASAGDMTGSARTLKPRVGGSVSVVQFPTGLMHSRKPK